jgi:hypothetical protein
MRAILSLGLLPLLITALATPATAQGQVISGVVNGPDGAPFPGIGVEFRDAQNAEILGTATTDLLGTFESSALPSGWYRIRFWDELSPAFPKWILPLYYGTGHDVFCDGTEVFLPPEGEVSISQILVPVEPEKTPGYVGNLGGVITDASGHPLSKILVEVFAADSGVKEGQITTEVDGSYKFDYIISHSPQFVVRFSDPARIHSPQYYGASGLDAFCLAKPEDLVGYVELNAQMQLIPPTQQTEHLTDQIEAMPLPAQVSNVLATPLTRAADLLDDDNPNNDNAVCHQLDSFITRVAIQEKKGQLTVTEAADLIDSARAIQQSMGCN